MNALCVSNRCIVSHSKQCMWSCTVAVDMSSEVVRVSSTAHSLPRELSDSALPAAPGGTSGQYVEGSGQLLEE